MRSEGRKNVSGSRSGWKLINRRFAIKANTGFDNEGLSESMSLLSLPSDILIIITSHLSLADLLLLTLVSRKFHRLVSHHLFTTPILHIIS